MDVKSDFNWFILMENNLMRAQHWHSEESIEGTYFIFYSRLHLQSIYTEWVAPPNVPWISILVASRWKEASAWMKNRSEKPSKGNKLNWW